MLLLDQLAEKHIEAAVEHGDLRGLPGEGKPLNLDDDAGVPEALRAGYRLLKNAGYLPPELQLYGELKSAERLIAAATGGEARGRAERRAMLLRVQLGATDRGEALLRDADYAKQIRQRLS